MIRKPNIRKHSLPELEALFVELGEPKFRARQVHEWLWQKGVGSFADMTNLSKPLRDKLEAAFAIDKVEVLAEQRSQDGTIKYAFRLSGGHEVEGGSDSHQQARYRLRVVAGGLLAELCFLRHGLLDLKHNLHHYEIFDQVQLLRDKAEEEYGRPLTNIVYMGMGEPLLNYRNVMASIERVTAEDGLGMSPRRITVSTAGIAKMIKKLADDDVKFEFALSLHAGNDEKRSKVMPINDSNSLEALREALVYFHDKTGTRVTFEYCIFKDFNDSIQDARELAAFSRVVPSKINVIEYNPVPEAGFVNTSPERMDAFIAHLEREKVIVNGRSRGKDVDGGCGQLALKRWEKA